MPTPEQDKWLFDVLNVKIPPRGSEPKGGGSGDSDAAGGGGSIFDTLKGMAKDAAKQISKELAKPKKPVPRAELGETQKTRADSLLAGMSEDDQAKVKKILDSAEPDQKKYLTKALASKHSAAEITAFNKKIAGKSKTWMEANLHLVGNSKGKGIRQQWHDSCGPTTVQAMMGELDPMYALKLHEENSNVTTANFADGSKINKKMGAEQKKMLEDHGGVAVSRSEDGGAGMVLDGLLNEQTAKIGVKFDIQSASDDTEMSAALDDAEKALKSGLPVPVRVGDDGEGGHFVLMTGIDPGPPRRYSFHDPWDAKTLVFTDQQIKTNDINIAGWTKMTHIFKPSAETAP